ncbi:MAG: LysE family transporter [Nitrospirota bacterium]
MNVILIIIAAYIMGCIAAIPAGPVQIEVVRRTINGHLRPALMVVLGAFCIDMLYGVIALFGIAPFLEVPRVMAIFWLAGGVILIALGVLSIRHSSAGEGAAGHKGSRFLRMKRWSFLGGLSLSLVNPVMILWWLSIVRIFRDIGLVDLLRPDLAWAILIAGALGLASYLGGLAFFLFWAKRFIPLKRLEQANRAFGILLLMLATYFIISSSRQLFFAG